MATAFQQVVTKVRQIGAEAASRAFLRLGASQKAAAEASDSLSRSGARQASIQATVAAVADSVSRSIGRKTSVMLADNVATKANTRENVKNAASQASLAAAADSAAFSFGRVSLNVFSFTIALKDMATQIPILVTGLGSLLSVVIALGSAAAVAGAGLAGMITGGLIQMAGELQDKYEDIEDTMEAIQAIGEAVRDLFVQALSPLVTPKNAALTKTLIEGVAEVVHWLATAIDNLMVLGDDSGILPMMRNLAGIFQEGLLGGEETTGIINQLGYTFQRLQGPLEDTARVLTNSVVPALEFFTDITLKLQDSGSAFVQMLGRWLKAAVELGSTVADGFLPVLTTLLAQTMHLMNAVNSVNPEIISLVAQFATAAAMVKFLTGPLGTLASTLDTASRSMGIMYQNSQTLTGALGSLADGFFRMTAAVMPGLLNIGQSFASVLNQMGVFKTLGLDSVIGGLENLRTTIHDVDNDLNSFGDVMTAIAKGEIDELNTEFAGNINATRLMRVAWNDAAQSLRGFGASFAGAARSVGSNIPILHTAFAETPIRNYTQAVGDAVGVLRGFGSTILDSGGVALDAVKSLFVYEEALTGVGGAANKSAAEIRALIRAGKTPTEEIATGLEAVKLHFLDAANAARAYLSTLVGSAMQNARSAIGTLTTSIWRQGGAARSTIGSMYALAGSFLTLELGAGSALRPLQLTRTVLDELTARTAVFGLLAAPATLLQDSLFLVAGAAQSMTQRILRSVTAIVTKENALKGLVGMQNIFWDLRSGATSFLNSLRDDAVDLFVGGLVRMKNGLTDLRGTIGGIGRSLDQTLPTFGTFREVLGMSGDMANRQGDYFMDLAANSDTLRGTIGALIAAYQAKAAALVNNISAENLHNLALRVKGRTLWGNVAALVAWAKGLAVGTALLLAKTAAAIGLNAVLGGIPVIIGGIVTAIAALGGAIVALGGPSEAWSSTIGGIREALGNMVEFLLKETVPIFNSIMTTIRAIMDPIYSLINGVFRIGEALGILSDEGSAGSSVINLLRTTVSALITAVELAWGVFASLTNIIGTLAGLIIDRLVGGIVNTINGLREIGGSIFNIAEGLPVIGRLIDAFRIFRELIAEIPGMLSAIPAILTDVMESVVNDAISLTNKLIRVLDNLPGVNISEVGKVSFDTKDTVTTDDVTEMMEADESDDVKKALDAPPDFDPELNIFQETSVSGTFNMAPEEEQRVKRLVEDAVEDANQFRRRRESGGG